MQVFRGKFIALNVNIRKKGRANTDDLSFYIRELEKEEQIKSKVNKRK